MFNNILHLIFFKIKFELKQFSIMQIHCRKTFFLFQQVTMNASIPCATKILQLPWIVSNLLHPRYCYKLWSLSYSLYAHKRMPPPPLRHRHTYTHVCKKKNNNIKMKCISLLFVNFGQSFQHSELIAILI